MLFIIERLKPVTATCSREPTEDFLGHPSVTLPVRLPPKNITNLGIALGATTGINGFFAAFLQSWELKNRSGVPLNILQAAFSMLPSLVRATFIRGSASVANKNVASEIDASTQAAIDNQYMQASLLRKKLAAMSFFALLDSIFAGIPVNSKVWALRAAMNLNPYASSGIESAFRRSMVDYPLRFLVSSAQAYGLACLQPKAQQVVGELGVHPVFSNVSATFLSSAMFALVSTPIRTIQAMVYKQAAQSEDGITVSIARAARESWKLHGPRLFTVGFGNMLMQNVCLILAINGGLWLAGKVTPTVYAANEEKSDRISCVN